MAKHLEKYLALQMVVEKSDGETGDDPGAIAHELLLILKDSVIAPVMTLDGAENTKAAIFYNS